MTASLKKKKKPSSEKARKRTDSPYFRKVVYKILLSLNILFGFTLLLSYIAVHINPEDFALPAFFGLAYPYLLLINILFVVAWAMLLKYEAFISLVIIILGFNHFSNYIRLFRQKNDNSSTFKVMSYNVHMFNVFENKSGNTSQSSVYNFIKSRKPDIFCLQEFYTTGNPSQAVTTVNSITGQKYYSHIKVMGSGKNRFYGIATFSRYPVVKKGEINHPGSSSMSIYTDVVIQKDTFRIFNNHLQSFRLKTMERSFLEEISASDKETFSEVKNLSSRLKKGFVSRAIQAQVLKNYVKRSPYPVIVAGDFNDTPVSYAYRKIRKGLHDSFVESGYGAGFTYKGNYPPNRIDYILYDNWLVSTWFEIIKVKYSDHYPIMAYFRKKG
jgi:endonuclease/exonuclease/phosphatase family metal-dependent hydrolase